VSYNGLVFTPQKHFKYETVRPVDVELSIGKRLCPFSSYANVKSRVKGQEIHDKLQGHKTFK